MPPVWFTFLKQPFAVVQAGKPYALSKVARSDSMFGSSKASTMPIVCAAGAVVGSP